MSKTQLECRKAPRYTGHLEESEPEWLTPKGRIRERVFCRVFLQKYPMVNVNGTFFNEDGIIADTKIIQKEIFDEIKDHVTEGLSNKSKKLMEAVMLECLENRVIKKQTDRIHVANGTLYLDGTFSEEKQACRNRLKVAYHADAPQPENWLRFLDDLLEPEDILTLQEFMGYCLIPSTRGQAMLLIKGNGGEGKSRIGVIIHKMFGTNAKNGSIPKVETSPFARADLQHVLVMVDDDLSLKALKTTGYIKSIITAETPMDLERKKEQSFQGDMFVRFIAFSNGNLEALYDHSDGFFRRQLILSTKKRPEDRQDDPNLIDKLIPELEGIFLWCLEGLHRLLDNNYRFTISAKSVESKEFAKRNANNVIEFMRSEGYIRLKADATIPSKDLYAIYKMWCEDNGYTTMALRTMSGTLKDHADEFNLEASNKITNSLGKQVNGFWGIEALANPNPF